MFHGTQGRPSVCIVVITWVKETHQSLFTELTCAGRENSFGPQRLATISRPEASFNLARLDQARGFLSLARLDQGRGFLSLARLDWARGFLSLARAYHNKLISFRFDRQLIRISNGPLPLFPRGVRNSDRKWLLGAFLMHTPVDTNWKRLEIARILIFDQCKGELDWTRVRVDKTSFFLTFMKLSQIISFADNVLLDLSVDLSLWWIEKEVFEKWKVLINGSLLIDCKGINLYTFYVRVFFIVLIRYCLMLISVNNVLFGVN